MDCAHHTGPVVNLEHRALWIVGDAPEDPLIPPIAKETVVREGSDLTIVDASLMVLEAVLAAEVLRKSGISAEIVDLRCIRPKGECTILASVKKTGRLIATVTRWRLCGIASEVGARAAEKAFFYSKAPVRRITLANCSAPVSAPMEKAFCPTVKTIVDVALDLMERSSVTVGDIGIEDNFVGPYQLSR